MSRSDFLKQDTLSSSDTEMSSTKKDMKQTTLLPASAMTTDTAESEKSLSQEIKTSTSSSATEPQFLSPQQEHLLQRIGLRERMDLRPSSGSMSRRSQAAKQMVSKVLKESRKQQLRSSSRANSLRKQRAEKKAKLSNSVSKATGSPTGTENLLSSLLKDAQVIPLRGTTAVPQSGNNSQEGSERLHSEDEVQEQDNATDSNGTD